MPEQLAIRYSMDFRLEESWNAVATEFAAVVQHVTAKAFCYAVDARASSLSHAMSGTDGHAVQAKWLLYAIAVAPNDRLANAVLKLANMRAEPLPKSPEQRVVELEQFIRRNPSLEKAAKDEGVLP